MPMQLVDYLKLQYSEPQPAWLDLARPEMDPETRRAVVDGFLRSRIVYYPGAGNDGQPIKLFNRAHAAHAYFYVDYGISRQQLHQNFTPDGQHPQYGFRGYQTVAILDFQRPEVLPEPDPAGRLNQEGPGLNGPWPLREGAPYAAMYVLERLPEFSEEHGAERFAVFAVYADGFAAYSALFCRPESIARPFCVVYEEVGIFGGNWNRFGGKGLFPHICAEAGIWPELLLVAENSLPWPGYDPVPDVEPETGGWYHRLRRLYRSNGAHHVAEHGNRWRRNWRDAFPWG